MSQNKNNVAYVEGEQYNIIILFLYAKITKIRIEWRGMQYVDQAASFD